MKHMADLVEDPNICSQLAADNCTGGPGNIVPAACAALHESAT